MEPLTHPFAQWQIVEVSWQAHGESQRIFHDLSPDNPRDVRYILIRSAWALQLDDDLESSLYATYPWTRDSIVLKPINATATYPFTSELLLFVPRKELQAR